MPRGRRLGAAFRVRRKRTATCRMSAAFLDFQFAFHVSATQRVQGRADQVPQRSSTGNRERDGRVSLSAVRTHSKGASAMECAGPPMARDQIRRIGRCQNMAPSRYWILGFAAGLASAARPPAVQQPRAVDAQKISQVRLLVQALRNINNRVGWTRIANRTILICLIRKLFNFSQGRGQATGHEPKQFFRASAAGLVGRAWRRWDSVHRGAGRNPATSSWRAPRKRATPALLRVGCGVIMYGLGDKARNVTTSIIHIEGDPDSSGQ